MSSKLVHFFQKKFPFVKIEHGFGAKYFHYSVGDEYAKTGFSIPYVEVPDENHVESFHRTYTSFMSASIAVAVAAAYYGSKYLDKPVGIDKMDIGFLWFFMSIAIIIYIIGLFFGRYDATIIPTNMGDIVVVHDNSHQSIISEIYKRKKEEIIRIYGEVDSLNHPEDEMNKFLWLKDNNFISTQEFEKARTAIIASADNGQL
ncbi:MAG: hypothetical protein R3D71_00830 [Rickettsiales bacterium]